MARRAAVWGLLMVFMATHWAVASPQSSTDIIDRIVAAINHTYIILASDVRRERAVMMALGEPDKNDREILEDLVGWRLLEEQMAQFPGIDVTDEELAAGLKKIDSLAASLEDVRNAVRQRIRRQKYVERRFGQFIHVTEAEKEQYYRDVFVPAAKKEGISPIPELADLPAETQESLVRNVVAERTAKEVLSALEALRARSDVEFF